MGAGRRVGKQKVLGARATLDNYKITYYLNKSFSAVLVLGGMRIREC
jgi:hypothetical protein